MRHGVYLAFALAATSPLQAQERFLLPEGDVVTIAVATYSRDGSKVPSEIAARYSMTIRCLSEQTVLREKCAVVEFVPGPDAPRWIGSPITLVCRRTGGMPLKVIRDAKELLGGAVGPDSGPSGKESFLTSAPEGFPIEVVTTRPTKIHRQVGGPLLFESKRLSQGIDRYVLMATLLHGEREQLKVVQEWGEQGTWWRGYERHVN